QHLLVEAGTGTGKSLAYLIPAFAWASKNGQRVVVSTNTINLQDQLIHKDTPDLCQALKFEYRAAVLKGRANYLCPRRLEALRRLAPQTVEEMRVLAKILVWLEQGGSGDRGEINLRSRGEAAAWHRLSADNPGCSIENCLRLTGGACPYYQARQLAESAHVIIVNHALLLADIATGNRVIPEYKYLLVDEAHHLESATTQAMRVEVSERGLQSLLRELHGGSAGLLGRVSKMAKAQLDKEAAKDIEQRVGKVSDRTRECQDLVASFFSVVTEFLQQRREGKPIGYYEQRERIVASSRKSSEWAAIEIAWENLRAPLALVVKATNELGEWLTDLADQGIGPAEDLAVAIRIIGPSLESMLENLEKMVFEPEASSIYWAEASAQYGHPSLHVAPLEVGPLVEKYLWFEKESVVMTSATLTTGGEFDFIRRRLSATDAEEIALGSPFDYESSTLLYLVDDIPEPTAGQGYERALERGLIALTRETQGRTLALFTSYAHMRRAAAALARPLETAGIRLIEQSSGAPRHVLLESFRTTEKAVLLGTRSFWEGVDVPGPALSVLAIMRLPFGVPTDPIAASRAETYESPFNQYAVPEAILRFRQGFGRLIRTRSDRGVAVVFDRRVLSKSYGPHFIRSLPACTLRQGPLADLPSAASRWLGD
ncbi:MAG: helicase C-terminal domain-containing protein, partial [Anaerolineales bacterium]